MAVDRAMIPGLPVAGNPNEQPLEIMIENPDAVTVLTEDGGAMIDFDPDSPLLAGIEHGDNLAEYIDDRDLADLASTLVAAFMSDKESRSDWEKSYIEGLDLLGMKFEDRTKPWDGACGVFHPMLAEAVVRFQSQTIQEIFPASGPVKVTIVGDRSPERIKQANRVREYMNFKATREMDEYRDETEKLLFSLPLAGSAFRKVYHDPNLGRECAMFVPAEDLVVSYGASSLATCGRITHVMKRSENDVRKLQYSGFYRDVDLDQPSPDISEIERKYADLTGDSVNIDNDDRHTLLEMQVDVDLPGFEDTKEGIPTGIALPYVITIDKSSGTILSIYRNWKEGDKRRLKREHFTHYQYLPGLGFYGFGLVHMIGGLSKSATSLLRQLVDAGTLANLPGGLKARGLRIKGDDSPIMPGEFRDVDVPGGSIRDNIQFLPYKEPSGVLYQLLQDIVGEGRRFASAADVKAADMNAEAPVGTTLAILEREMKVMSAIQARIHKSMGKELQMLADLIKEHGPDQYPYAVSGEYSIREDFDDRIDIIPVSDPNAGTMAQRIMQYQAALQLAAQAPQMYDMPRLHRQMLDALGIQEADEIVPLESEMHPTDPVSENMALLTGEPVKAFLYQDHEAHIQTHTTGMQHPKVMELMAQNPQAQAVQAAMQAHIAEHLSMLYRQQIEKELGLELPPPDQPLPEDIELRLSRLVAPAAAQLTGKAQQQQQAEENAKKQEDPIIQLQQEELRLREEKIRADERAKMAAIEKDREKEQMRLLLEQEKLAQKERVEGGKLALKSAVDQAKIELEEDKLQLAGRKLDDSAEKEGFKLGMDVAERMIQRKRDSDGRSE